MKKLSDKFANRRYTGETDRDRQTTTEIEREEDRLTESNMSCATKV